MSAARSIACGARDPLMDGGFSGVIILDEEMGIRESNLYGLFFPPDLESSHKYFEIYVQITSIDSAVRFHKDPERGLFEALVRGLEVDGPFADIPGPAGALARAIVAGDSEAALKAVDEGAGVNATLSDWTPLEAAAACDRRDLAGMLVRDERLTGAFSWGTALTPLLLALVAGHRIISFNYNRASAASNCQNPQTRAERKSFRSVRAKVDIIYEIFEESWGKVDCIDLLCADSPPRQGHSLLVSHGAKG